MSVFLFFFFIGLYLKRFSFVIWSSIRLWIAWPYRLQMTNYNMIDHHFLRFTYNLKMPKSDWCDPISEWDGKKTPILYSWNGQKLAAINFGRYRRWYVEMHTRFDGTTRIGLRVFRQHEIEIEFDTYRGRTNDRTKTGRILMRANIFRKWLFCVCHWFLFH